MLRYLLKVIAVLYNITFLNTSNLYFTNTTKYQTQKVAYLFRSQTFLVQLRELRRVDFSEATGLFWYLHTKYI